MAGKDARKTIFFVLILAVSCSREGYWTSGRSSHVLAFYYPWYGVPPTSSTWVHWADAGHNPDAYIGGLRDTASTHHPVPDVYDSNDPTTIRRHLQLAEMAGIDGIIVSWWGKGSFEDLALEKLAEQIEDTGSPVKFTVYYEAVPGYDPMNAVDDLSYILEKYRGRASFFTLRGRPVIFVYGRAIFPILWCGGESCPPGTPGEVDWTEITTMMRERYNALFVGDCMTLSFNINMIPELARMGFGGAHFYNPQLDIKTGADMENIYRRLVSESSRNGLLSAATVIPGYDDSHIGRAVTSVVERQGGDLYTRLWRQAHDARPDMILITTFNEWHEGTEIEPSHEFGDLYIRLTRERTR